MRARPTPYARGGPDRASNVKVGSALHERLSDAAAYHGTYLRDIVIAACEAWLDRDEAERAKIGRR